MICLFEEDEARLKMEDYMEVVSLLEPGDIERLTEDRVAVLEVLLSQEGAMRLSEVASSVRRDRERVEDDLEVLEEVGLVLLFEVGGEAMVRPEGTRITIELEG